MCRKVWVRAGKFELRLNDFQNSFVKIFMNFLDTYRKIPKKYYDTEHVRLLTFISFSPQLRVFRT